MKKLAIVSTHPIQYNAPLFALLAKRARIKIKVFYTWSQAQEKVFDPGFDTVREWDIPLLDGYDYTFVENVSKAPGSHHFSGIKNPKLISEIETWHPDAVLVYGWAFESHLRCLRHFKNKIAVFFRGDSTLLNEQRGVRKIIRRSFLRWVYRYVDFGFYVGTNNKKYFRVHGLKSSQLIHAPHAIDNDRFYILNAADHERIEAYRKQLKLSKNDFVVLFAGKLEAVKNPFFLLDLAKQIHDPEVKFLFVGNGPLEKDLKEKAAGDRRILFLDFQNQTQMPLVYRLGSVFILPSRSETWGLAANEAMACALPVLLSANVGGAVDLVEDNGLIFQFTETEKLASYLQSLKTDADAMETAKKRSVIKIQEFRIEIIAAALENQLMKGQ